MQGKCFIEEAEEFEMREKESFLFRMEKPYEIVSKHTLVVHILSIRLSRGHFS
jgi:hypothetical protein